MWRSRFNAILIPFEYHLILFIYHTYFIIASVLFKVTKCIFNWNAKICLWNIQLYVYIYIYYLYTKHKCICIFALRAPVFNLSNRKYINATSSTSSRSRSLPLKERNQNDKIPWWVCVSCFIFILSYNQPSIFMHNEECNRAHGFCQWGPRRDTPRARTRISRAFGVYTLPEALGLQHATSIRNEYINISAGYRYDCSGSGGGEAGTRGWA